MRSAERVRELVELVLDAESGNGTRFQELEGLHTTVVRIDEDWSVHCVQELIAGISTEAPFEYKLIGPHLTARFDIILELQPTTDEPNRLREAVASRLHACTRAVNVPDIHHVTVARTRGLPYDSLRALGSAIEELRLATGPSTLCAREIVVRRASSS